MEAEAVATEVPLGVLVDVDGVKRAAEAGFEVAQQRVDPAELRQFIGVLTTGDDGLMAAACRGDGAEAGQAIGERGAPRSQVLPGPGADRLGAEPSHRRDFGVNRVTCAEVNGCNDGNLDLRSSTCRAARSFSSEVGIIHLDLSPQHVGIFPLAHGPENLVVQQPGGVVLHAQMAAELERGDAGFGLPDQIERLKQRNHQASGLSPGLPHIAPRFRRASGTQTGRGLSGTGSRCAPWLDWHLCTSL